MPHIDISEFDEVAAELPFVKSQSSSKKYFLVKLPTDVDITLFNGKVVDLKKMTKGGSKVMEVDSGANGHFELKRDSVPIHTTTRCLVQQEKDICLGPAFSGSLTLSRAVGASVPKKDDKNIIDTYCKIDQQTGLTVRSLPFGSRTSLSELRERLETNTTAKSSKKRAHRDEEHSGKGDVTTVDVEKKKKSKKKKGE